MSKRGMGTAVVVGAVLLVAASCSRDAGPASPSSLASTPGVSSPIIGGETEHVHAGAGVSENSPNLASELAAVRAATAKYHDVTVVQPLFNPWLLDLRAASSQDSPTSKGGDRD
jgi:hypothetical protein